ncbi:MFS transporter [Streptomyces sp. NBC_01275]|uniref:MFS transporter n=1 Tax=Streptomyces sp. NBC_01275 TaxID=2903807 RepID=UPI002253F9CC|nr:MFS transporter [Streptomyces sp. NBC_01275]MCX4764121.1 MFS transporter [Streptomyces sp. NBC_01275]
MGGFVRVLAFAVVLRHARFRRVWCGQAASAVGDGVTLVALPGAVLAHHSKTDLGLVLGAQSLALVGAALLGGVLADRLRRSWVMAAADVVRLVTAVCFALGAARAPLLVPVLLALATGFAAGVFTPAFGALIPDLVPDEDLPKANALRSITVRTGQVLGPALGGLLLAAGTAGATSGTASGAASGTAFDLVFWLDAGTFAASVATLGRVGDPRPARTTGGTVLRQAREGLAAVRERTWVLTIIVQGTLQLLLVMAPVAVLLPIILAERGEFAAYGPMVALQAVGSVAGGMAIAAWSPRRPGTVAVLGLGLLAGQLACLLANAPLTLLGLSMAVTGFGYAVFNVAWASALQRAIPSDKLGRVFAIDTIGTYGLQPLGFSLAPLAATAFGNGPVLWTGLAALTATTAVPLFQRDVRRFADAGQATAGA